MEVQEKKLVDSTLKELVQSGLMQFSKLCLNLYSLTWLKPCLNLHFTKNEAFH